ncbi:sigma factor [Roseomonas sp. E05]|uniref:sigma factor n=1 Tax=Roseomonas sp. E05 TaxID=3046310 RepID=UPI0024BA051A|nr:sigma factor [Roseomonas sp. E05]MDJ0391071.1 sigma factor [Roseomonas sp. E05]
MSASPSTLDTATLYRDADRMARRTVRSGRLPTADREDLRQDLLLDLLRRLRHYDPARGSLGAFAQVCFQHRAARAVSAHRREIRERHGFRLHSSHAVNRHEPTVALALRLDLGRALDRLSPAQAAVVTSLVDRDIPAAPRTTGHRHLQAVRDQLAAAGLGRTA